ncbi:hypothetical protein JCM3765_003867 [Sporobolomyces pararoseus]
MYNSSSSDETKGPFSLYASSSVLAQNCPYFETMFGSGFAEARKTSDSARLDTTKEEEEVELTRESAKEEEDVPDDDSDFELDDLPGETESLSPKPGAEYHPLYIQGIAHSTY